MSQMQQHQATAIAVIQEPGTSIHSQHGTYADMHSTEAQDMFRARLVRGQTCSSAPDVGAGAELGLAMGDGASGDDCVSCIAAFCCLLAFFLWLLVNCNSVVISTMVVC